MSSAATTPELLGGLLQRVAAGDQEAFATFYDAVSARVHGLVLRILRDPAQSEEVTQEVFVQVWREAPSFDPARGSALSWLLTVAHRRAVDRVRSESAQSKREVVYESRNVTRSIDSTSETVEGRWQAQEVRRAVADLGDRHKEAIELAYFHGLTHREVSERLGLPLGTAKTRIRDGLSKLRQQMGGGP
ncbi:MAG: ECF RNA polymerase sigma factor SigK [Actinomycetota bacterium]|nr:ECF RNA polymerase sigma factor SigK [Actinomycetota bacterium]